MKENKQERLYNSNTSSNYITANVTNIKSSQVTESMTNTGFTPLESWDSSKETSGNNLIANRPRKEPVKIDGPITFINATLWERTSGAYGISFILNKRYGSREDQLTGNMSAKGGRFSDFARGIIKSDPWYKATKENMISLRDELTLSIGADLKTMAVNRIMIPVKQTFGAGRNVYGHTGVLLAITEDNEALARLYINDQTWDILFTESVSDAQYAKGAVNSWKYRGDQNA